MAEKGRRKTVDKWKKKKWFTINSSKIFGSKPLAETPAEKPNNLIGRTMKVTLDVLTGQRARRDITVYFKTEDVQGQNINTKISKYITNKGSLSRLVRRRNSKVALVEKVPVVGGDARITVIIVTANKANQKQRTGIRAIIKEELKVLRGKEFEEVVKETLLGKFSKELMNKAFKVCPVKKSLVAKVVFIKSK